MTPPPRDRWIVVWTDAFGPHSANEPFVTKYVPENQAWPVGSSYTPNRLHLREHDIAAWAECPARPTEGDGE